MNKIYLLIYVILFSSPSFARKKLVLGTFLIPRYVQSPKKGEFIKLTKKIAGMTGYDVEIIVFPPKRTLRNLKIKKIGINEHFKSISRGVIDTRDVIYFISVTLFFLFITKTRLDHE